MTAYLNTISAHLSSIDINISPAMIGGFKAGAALGLVLSIPKIFERMRYSAEIGSMNLTCYVKIGPKTVTEAHSSFSREEAEKLAGKLNSIPRLLLSIMGSMLKAGVWVGLAAHAVSTQYPNSPLNSIILRIANIGA